MDLLISIVVSYFIGAIPTSFILVKIFGGKNIFESGSGNAGALNSYETTGNKAIGISVLLIDFFKGALAAFVGYNISGEGYLPFMASLIWVLIGHNYNIFFRGKGGRGLATAAGAFAMVSPYFVVTWLIVWVAGYYVVRKNVHIANGIALLGSTILIFSTPDAMFAIASILQTTDLFALKLTYSFASIVILLRHIEPLKELARNSESQ